jgi:hypothetical protein
MSKRKMQQIKQPQQQPETDDLAFIGGDFKPLLLG